MLNSNIRRYQYWINNNFDQQNLKSEYRFRSIPLKHHFLNWMIVNFFHTITSYILNLQYLILVPCIVIFKLIYKISNINPYIITFIQKYDTL